VAESIAFSLRSRKHAVFLDHDDLPPGESFDQRIGRAIGNSNAFIFLISPDSVAQGRYTLTELAFARRKWPTPSKRVLPVMARKKPIEQIPVYLRAVTILEPHGDITAETSDAVDRMLPRLRYSWLMYLGLGAVCVIVIITMIVLSFYNRHLDNRAEYPETNETRVHSFEFQTPPQEVDPGLRRWTRISPDEWEEKKPDGSTNLQRVVKRIRLYGCDGTMVNAITDPNFQLFFPDQNCQTKQFMFRRKSQGTTWHGYAPIINVQ
jgi:hypothetical protein